MKSNYLRVRALVIKPLVLFLRNEFFQVNGPNQGKIVWAFGVRLKFMPLRLELKRFSNFSN